MGKLKQGNECAEAEKLNIHIQLDTPWGSESYRLPSCQITALRAYLNILSRMNAANAKVTPAAAGKSRR